MLVKKFTKREQDVDVIRGVRKASSVTPSDSDHLVDPDGEPLPTRSVYVGVSGDLSVVFADNDTVVLVPAVAAGVWHPMEVRQIRTASTATGIVAGW
jgi:hypothetical protein